MKTLANFIECHVKNYTKDYTVAVILNNPLANRLFYTPTCELGIIGSHVMGAIFKCPKRRRKTFSSPQVKNKSPRAQLQPFGKHQGYKWDDKM